MGTSRRARSRCCGGLPDSAQSSNGLARHIAVSRPASQRRSRPVRVRTFPVVSSMSRMASRVSAVSTDPRRSTNAVTGTSPIAIVLGVPPSSGDTVIARPVLARSAVRVTANAPSGAGGESVTARPVRSEMRAMRPSTDAISTVALPSSQAIAFGLRGRRRASDRGRCASRGSTVRVSDAVVTRSVASRGDHVNVRDDG